MTVSGFINGWCLYARAYEKFVALIALLVTVWIPGLASAQNPGGPLQIGQEAIAVDSLKTVTIIAIEQTGQYVVRDQFGNTYVNVDVSDLAVEYGCYGNLCVGQQVIAVDSAKSVTVVALQFNGSLVVRDMYGNTYANINASDLAVEYGCYGSLCIGQTVIAVDSVKSVVIVALESSGLLVVRDDFGDTYANISSSDLATEYGCIGNLCTGELVVALDSGKSVTIIAVEQSGLLVVRDDFGNTYANISASDL
jgi:hypothetical protein